MSSKPDRRDAGRPPGCGRVRGGGYCWVEAGTGRAALATGGFFAEPDPTLALREQERSWQDGKVLFERSWIGGRLERRLAGPSLLVAASSG